MAGYTEHKMWIYSVPFEIGIYDYCYKDADKTSGTMTSLSYT